jgi:hypothetical protein
MTNLQVWPKDAPRAQVIQTMNAFNESLGVECNYCHVQDAGGRFDFASDEKREKKVARQMILLRDSINVMMAAIVDKPAGAGPTAGEGAPGAPVRVLCRSCHRGLPIPRAIADVVTEAAAGGGAAAGLAKYKELRARYYGGQEYDFGETSLLTIAQRAMTAKSPDGAIAYLQENLEYFPKSARTYQAMAQARNADQARSGISRKPWSSIRRARRRGTSFSSSRDSRRWSSRPLSTLRTSRCRDARKTWFRPVSYDPSRHQPGGAGKATSGRQECQQVGVELVFVRVREAVGCARVDLEGRVLDQLR